MNRIELFYQQSHFKNLVGLPEKIIEKEKEVGESIGNNFHFSKREYTNEMNQKIILGKINYWYFLWGTGKEYKVFEDKRDILLYIKEQFNKANKGNKENNIDQTWKAFWTREIETI